jgi:hypothetical protein
MIIRTTKWIEENETDYKKKWVCLESLQKEIEEKQNWRVKHNERKN